MLKGVEGVMKGYKPQVDWGGEGGSATIMMGRHNVKVATAGWRRRCIFIFLGALLIISILNFILTCWILRKIKFNAEGAGNLLVKTYAIEVEGKTYTTKELRASSIKGKGGKNFDVIGYYNLSANIMSQKGQPLSTLTLDPDRLEAVAEDFKVLDSNGNTLFEAKHNEINVGAKHFTVTGMAGASINGSVQTPRLIGSSIEEFRLESKTRDLTGTAANSLVVEARAGDINSVSLKDQLFSTKNGKIRFASSNVQFPNIPVSLPSTTSRPETQIPAPVNLDSITTSPSPTSDEMDSEVQVFQVCVCANGKLFLTSDDSICTDEENICLP